MEFFAHLFTGCAKISELISCPKDQCFHIACQVAYALGLVMLAEWVHREFEHGGPWSCEPGVLID